jgi:hypothetical protein
LKQFQIWSFKSDFPSLPLIKDFIWWATVFLLFQNQVLVLFQDIGKFIVLHQTNPYKTLNMSMSASAILSASWEKYDLKKELVFQDKNIFCPENLWEFNHLMDSILMIHPNLDIITVMLSIRKSMRETVAPRPRTRFVQAVMESISERENQFTDLVENSKRMAS